jgi:hypothetical protein
LHIRDQCIGIMHPFVLGSAWTFRRVQAYVWLSISVICICWYMRVISNKMHGIMFNFLITVTISFPALHCEIQLHTCILTDMFLVHSMILFNLFYSISTESPLTLSVRTEYIYSTASLATSPDGVYILHDFHKVVKWPGTVDFKF